MSKHNIDDRYYYLCTVFIYKFYLFVVIGVDSRGGNYGVFFQKFSVN